MSLSAEPFEGEKAWRALLERYADGRKLCNCRCAYQDDCQSVGCASAGIMTREDIAPRILAELPA